MANSTFRTPQQQQTTENLARIWLQKKKELKLTQEKAALAFGWSAQATVSQYLRGIIPLGLDTGLKFATLLQVLPSDINPEWAYLDAASPLSADSRLARIAEKLKAMDQAQLDQAERILDALTAGK